MINRPYSGFCGVEATAAMSFSLTVALGCSSGMVKGPKKAKSTTTRCSLRARLREEHQEEVESDLFGVRPVLDDAEGDGENQRRGFVVELGQCSGVALLDLRYSINPSHLPSFPTRSSAELDGAAAR